jgi:DNA-binding NarL/FixJ family response regulator
MARVLALSADLLFGSRLQADLAAGGHELELIGDAARLGERLDDDRAPGASVLIADLTDDRLEGAAVLEALRGEGRLAGLATIAFYSHVEADVRERAERAGFDLVVPRSRMARESAVLVSRLTS